MTYDTLLEQLSDPSPEVRETVCWALGQLAYREAARRLSRILKADPCEFVRLAAADALAQIGDPAATIALTGALEDPELLVRMIAVVALARLKDARAVDPLKRALDADENEKIRESILGALQQITGQAHRYLTAEERKIAKYLSEVRSHPDSGPAHYNLAVAYFHNGQYDLAHRHCEVAREAGMGIGWLKRRLDELPPDAEHLPPPSPERGPEKSADDLEPVDPIADLETEPRDAPSEDDPPEEPDVSRETSRPPAP